MSRDVFVSHANDDQALAVQVCELLEQRGLTCWIAPRDVGAGVEWDEAILDAIEQSRAFLLILSAHANQSSFVKNELNRAFSGGKPIVTFRLEDVVPGRSLELYLARHHWTDAFPPPLEPRVDQLAQSLKTLLGVSPHAPTNIAHAPKARAGHAPSVSALRGWMIGFAIAALAATALAIPAFSHLREPPLSETRVDIVTPDSNSTTDFAFSDFALSPDGRHLVYVAGGGAPRLWLRSLASAIAQPLAGTDGASAPFWSPDSRSVGFVANGVLKRLDLGVGQPQTLTPVGGGVDAAWSSEGVILLSRGRGANFVRIPATGGAVTEVTRTTAETFAHHSPYFLPDGKRFLFMASGGLAPGIYLGTLDGHPPVRVTTEVGRVSYLPSGWMLWLRSVGGALVAQKLDIEKATLTGDPVTVADGVVDASAVASGLIAYRMGTVRRRQLQWMDRAGTAQGVIGEADSSINAPRISPDGGRVVFHSVSNGNTDIWLLDGTRASRITFGAGREAFAAWSPDGNRLVYTLGELNRNAGDLYLKLANGAREDELLQASDRFLFPSHWSADGRYLLYFAPDPETQMDLWILPMTGERKPFAFLKTSATEVWGQFSPDGRWVAYQSNESGSNEVYVRPFNPPGAGAEHRTDGGKWQVSTGGGIHPVWRRDGKELYFLNPAGEMMAAPITISGSTFQTGAIKRLFPTRIWGGGVDGTQGRQYDVAPDGRFLVNTELDAGAPAPITLIQNWNPDAGK
jgi:eukaryotic-like serine/threonine-protein kinase